MSDAQPLINEQGRLDGRTLVDAIEESRLMVEQAIHEHKPQAVCGLFSGGNDSTVLMYVMGDYLTHAVHINTGIGIEKTREFVRDTCALNEWELIEETPPAKTYRDMVLENGFPGPNAHIYAYSWLKERALRNVRRRFVKERGQRVMFLTGVRVHESRRRMGTAKKVQRDGSVVWVAPLLHWTSSEMEAYRRLYPHIPRNEVADTLHMSGECLCGAYAKPGEREFLFDWFPNDPGVCQIKELEEATGKKWGQGGPPAKGRAGMLCTSCDNQQGLWEDAS